MIYKFRRGVGRCPVWPLILGNIGECAHVHTLTVGECGRPAGSCREPVSLPWRLRWCCTCSPAEMGPDLGLRPLNHIVEGP